MKQESHKKCRKYLELDKNENTIYPNRWDSAKPRLRGKYIALKQESSQIKYLTFYLKKLEIDEQVKPKESSQKK